ncbi:RHS repeat-associated core domain-containing protein [Chitinophaga nivalis]|uniref:Insecticide toxin TcdB middle/N-terminal domain-containing protein n=1 Tax=Chitinophaga nivalis TaxID=2991709 RepID=A0ABT3IJ08_9BACT|nr:RHS repeat-associated core domain-containing protein [Chitinophaga nivalis]MCW3466403.1 hypothetical protein [Chitinophaga nivalis]MCW3483906.1 hypothetical protein [Chitinophaga nivalis]
MTYAGSIPAKFSIDHNGGSNYTFQLDVPPGIAQMQPKLNLNYNSAWGNSLLGMGCQLNGLSVIERTGATLDQDGFIAGITLSDTDRLNIDHARMVLRTGSSYFDTGAIYETERQSWHKIVPVYNGTSNRQGPDSFTVYNPDGKIYRYGTTTDSQGVTSATNPTIMAWYLSSITDLSGNTITFTYTAAGTGWRRFPSRIDYTANTQQNIAARRSVRFNYENRQDIESGYVAGFETSASIRLTSLTTHVDETLVMTYAFTYEYSSSTQRSRLTAVTQSDKDGTALFPTTFSWQDAGCNYNAATTIPTSGIDWGGLFIPIDLTGNGSLDFVNAYSDSSNNLNLNIYLSQLNGKFSDAIPVQTNLQFGGLFIPLDANGDGKNELVYATQDNDNLALTLFTAQSSGNSWTLSPGTTQTTNLSFGGDLLAADVDGDGLADLVYSYQDNDSLGLNVLFSDGATFTPAGGTTYNAFFGGSLIAIDLNADGRDDLLYVTSDVNQNLSFTSFFSKSRNGFTQVNNTFTDQLDAGGSLIPIDINADGNMDLIYITGTDNVNLQILVNNGQTFSAGASLATGFSSGVSVMLTSLTAAPVPELLLLTQQDNNLAISVVRVFNAQLSMMSGINQFPQGTLFGGLLMPLDLYGTGFSNLVYLTDNDGTQATQVLSPTGAYPDLITTIANGTGGQYLPQYSPITDPAVYSISGAAANGSMEPRSLMHAKVNGMSYNIQLGDYNIPGIAAGKDVLQRTPIPKYVVGSYTKKDGIGGAWVTSYNYADAVIDRSGRGWLGFGSVSISDHSMDTTDQLLLLQTFPCTQVIKKQSTRRTSDQTFMKTVDYTYQTPQQNNAYLILNDSTITKYYTFAANTDTPDTTVTVGKQFDDHGNANRIDTDGNGMAARVTEIRNYINDETNWRIGLIHEHQYYADNGLQNLLKKEQFSYYDSTYLTKEHDIWESVAAQWLKTTYQYDAMGNLTLETDAAGFATTTTIEQSFYTFIASKTVTLATGVTLTKQFSYDPAFGKLTSKTEANGAIKQQETDGLGRVKSVSRTAPNKSQVATTQYSWTFENNQLCYNLSNRVSWTDDNWKTTKTYYDGLGRKTKITRPDVSGNKTIIIDTTYNESGQKLTETLPYFEHTTSLPITWTYDAFGRNIQQTTPAADPNNPVVTTTRTYSKITTEQVITAVGTPEARTTSVTHGLGPKGPLPLTKTSADGGSTQYQYNGLGLLISVTDPTNITTQISYDSLERKTAITTPAYSKSITYNDQQRTATETIAGNTVTLYKDEISRLTKKVTDKGEITQFTYDDTAATYGTGMLTKVVLPSGDQFTYGYNADALITTKQVTISSDTYTISKVYTPDAQTSSITFPDGAIQNNTYSSNGILKQIDFTGTSDQLTGLAVYDQFDMRDHPQLITYKNGVSKAMGYDNYGRIMSYQATSQQNNIFSDTIVRNATDAVINDGTTAQPNSYQYDSTGRLIAANENAETFSYQYDQSGNCTHLNGDTLLYQGYAPQSGGTNASFTAQYNTAGSLTQLQYDTTTTQYSYDSEQRLVAAGDDTFAYDHTGQRMVKSEPGVTTYYIAPEYEVVKFQGGNVQHTCHVNGTGDRIFTRTIADTGTPTPSQGIPAPGDTYFINDYRKNTRVTTDASGNTTATVTFDPFGNIKSQTGSNAFRIYFSDGEYDNGIKAYYMQSRYYDPRICHFLTPDDGFGGKLLDRDTYNLYAYVSSDPMGLTDPTGHSWLDFIVQTVIDVAYIAAGIGAIIITGGALANTIGAGLIGAGIGGLIYDVTQKVWEKPSDQVWGLKGWAGAMIIGGATGLAAGVGAYYLIPYIVGAAGVTSTFAVIGIKVITSVITGMLIGAGGKALSNVFNGKPVGSGVLSAAVFGGLASFLTGAVTATVNYSIFEQEIEEETTQEVQEGLEESLEETSTNETTQNPLRNNITRQLKRVPMKQRWFENDKDLIGTTIRFTFGSINKTLSTLHLEPSF